MTAAITRPALRYRGGKWRLAPWIISHFPVHECYVEPFMGACSVLLQKEPSDFEVINDLDQNVVAFFRTLRERPTDLEHAIKLTPLSRAEYQAAKSPADDELERARRFYTLCAQGRGSQNSRAGWRFQKSWNGWRNNFPQMTKNTTQFLLLAQRLSAVQIDCDDAQAVIKRFDAPASLFYVDPPYVPESRKNRRLYREEYSVEQHEALAATLRGIKGMALLSGYPSALYDRLYHDWRRVDVTAYAEAQRATTECLWISPAADAALSQRGEQMELLEKGDA